MTYRQPIASCSKDDGASSTSSTNKIHSDEVPLYHPTPLGILEGNNPKEQEKEIPSSLSTSSDVKRDYNHVIIESDKEQISQSSKTRGRVPENTATLDSSSEGNVNA